MTPAGKVYLIGAGPGDLELLTLKAIRFVRESDVILIDSLANREILQFSKPEARVMYVGKRAGKHSVPQTDIESQLIASAQEGLTVSRIKGGDPLLFARGGEEIEALLKHQIPYEIAPGVTAASGICASLKIPLTHRDNAHSVIYLTGPHFEPPAEFLCLPALHNFAGTIVVYMGLRSCEHVARELIERGLPSRTPAAAIQSGTLPEERVVFSSISELAQAVQEALLESPVLLIIGNVVSLAPSFRNQAVAIGGKR